MTTLDTDGTDAASDLAPRRLLDGGGSAFERRLVEPSQSQHVARASLERLALRLQLPPEALPPEALPPEALPEPNSHRSEGVPQGEPDAAPTTAEAVPARTASWLSRPAARLGLGAAGVVAIGMGITALRAVPSERAVSASATSHHMALGEARRAQPDPEPNRVSAPALTVTPATTTPAPAVSANGAEPVTRAAAPARRPAAASSRAVSSRAESSRAPRLGLGAELHALETVQHALAERRVDDASQALRAYREQFTEGELALEAELLGVEVALAKGHLEHARSQARALAARPAAARYRERIDALSRAIEARASGVKSTATHINGAEVNR